MFRKAAFRVWVLPYFEGMLKATSLLDRGRTLAGFALVESDRNETVATRRRASEYMLRVQQCRTSCE